MISYKNTYGILSIYFCRVSVTHVLFTMHTLHLVIWLSSLENNIKMRLVQSTNPKYEINHDSTMRTSKYTQTKLFIIIIPCVN